MNPSPHLTRMATAGLVLALALAGCGTGTGAESANGGAKPTDVALISAMPTGQTTNGEAFDFGSLEGTDAVLWFWAPW